MVIHARVMPERLLLMVLKAPKVTDLVSWNAIEREHRVLLAQVKDAYSFTPRLTAQYVLSGVDTGLYKTVVRFDYTKNNMRVKEWYEIHDFHPQDKIEPQEPFVLSEYLSNQARNRQGGQQQALVGMWKVATHVAFVQANRVMHLPPPSRQRLFFDDLRLTFKEVATFEFEIVGAVASLVDAGGTLIQPRGQTIHVVEYSVDEI